jgi:hypothetical protein
LRCPVTIYAASVSNLSVRIDCTRLNSLTMTVSAGRVSALLVSLLGALVLQRAYTWITWALAGYGNLDGGRNFEMLWFGIVACLAVSAAAAMSLYLAVRRQSSTYKGVMAVSIAGLPISGIGCLAFFRDSILGGAAVHYGVPQARLGWRLSQLGLLICGGAFLSCGVGIWRAARHRPRASAQRPI